MLWELIGQRTSHDSCLHTICQLIGITRMTFCDSPPDSSGVLPSCDKGLEEEVECSQQVAQVQSKPTEKI
jgi:hypothetical protein